MLQYQITTAKSGSTSLQLVDGDKVIRLHSAYDPLKEAIRAAEEFNPGRASIIVVCGLALGYHIIALHQRFPDHTILVIEKDNELVSLVKKENPLVLSLCSIVHSEEEIAAIIETWDIRSFRGTALFIHRPSYMLKREFYDSMVAILHKQISSRISDLLTRFEFEALWIKNILLNSVQMHTAYPVQSLFGKFKGIPGIIVSAGPSLIHSLEALRQAYDKALIVCVDTAYKVLQRHGIQPHIVMTLDAQTHSIKHFLGSSTKPLLLADVVSCPKVVRLFNKKMFSTTAKYYNTPNGKIEKESTPIMDWVQHYTGYIGDVQSGGSVATSAFDLLLNAGCSPIVLAGQDLAYTGREIHCRGTHHNDDWLSLTNRYNNLDTINQNIIRRRKIKYVPSNDGTTVITDFVLDLYRSWFEDSAKKVGIPVYNTGAGAAIANTQFATLQSLVLQWQKAFPAPEDIIYKQLSNKKYIDTSKLMKQLAKVKDALHNLDKAVQAGNTSCIYSILDDDAIDTLISPFMRKTLFYIARHNLEQEKIDTLIKDAALSAAHLLLKLFDRIAIK